MKEFDKVKQFYHHQEYQKAIDMVIDLIGRNVITSKSIEYPEIICCLGDSRLKLYDMTKNKSLIYEALTDYATAANSLLVHQKTFLNDLNQRLRKCAELL